MVTVMAMAMAAEHRSAKKRILLSVVMGCVTFSTFAEDGMAPSTLTASKSVASNAALSNPLEQDNQARAWKITPTIAVNETATDNVALSNVNKKNDLVTDINPGIRIEGSGGRSKLRLDYQLHNLLYAQESSRNQTQNSLNAFGTLEALQNWLFIDASGVISQQSISAFSGATTGAVNTNINGSTTETSTYRLSPYLRGVIGNSADYQLRYNLSTTNAKSNQVFNSDAKELLAIVKGRTALTNLGWSIDASRQKTESGNTHIKNEADRIRGLLTYNLDSQFRVSLIGGREINDYLNLNKEGYATKGAGFGWSPTERTQLSASRESRFFGMRNDIVFSHRTAGAALKFSESKDASVFAAQQSSVGLGTFYDLFNSLFSSMEPDPVKRAAIVNSMLLSSGISPSTQLTGGFLTSGVTLQHRRDMSFALLGARNTVTFAAIQSDSQGLSQGTGIGALLGSDFANVQNIYQRGLSINWSHRLSALSNLVGTVSRMNSKGTGSSALETTQQMVNLNFMTKLGPKTNAVVGARRIVVDGTANYSENAVTGSLSHQF